MSKMEFCDLHIQYNLIKKEIHSRIDRVLEHKAFINGPEIEELEKTLKDFLGSKHAIAVSSGTDGLLVPLLALNIGEGDYVITTPFTFAANVEAILLLKAKPLFIEIDSRTYNLDPLKLEELFNNLRDPSTNEHINIEKVKAIIPVDLYGQPCDYDFIKKAINGRDIPIIEDFAQAFGSSYKGKMAGTLGMVGVTSFFPSKPLGGYGDGGMIFTDDQNLADNMRLIRNHGQKGRYNHELLGSNFRMDTIQAAIILAKFELFHKEMKLRNDVAKKYNHKIKEIENSDKIIIPFVEEFCSSSFAQYTIRVGERDKLKDYLVSEKIPVSVHYPKPIYMQKAFSKLGYKLGDFPIAEIVSSEVISLPFDPYKTEEEINLVCSKINDFFEKSLAFSE